MRPIKLTMQAFGSYGKKTEIDFTVPKTNFFLVSGNTGAGKSTVFDAIVFALYGETSSENNKKSGEELVSQFAFSNADGAKEPYVELVFTEIENGVPVEYRVRREPKHVRPAKRKGAKDQNVSEKVCLRFPDGREHPGTNDDIKEEIEKIIGLTREQFMQVAMIAQGEFMELLRAKSDDKKEIYRKIFNTGIYENIVQRLKDEADALRTDRNRLRDNIGREAGRVEIYEKYSGSEGISELRKLISSSNDIRSEDAGRFSDELANMCRCIADDLEAAEKELASAEKAYSDVKDLHTAAMELMKTFIAVEGVERKLAVLRADAEEQSQRKLLLGKITDSLEIKAKYDISRNAADDAAKIADDLKKCRGRVPFLEEACVRAFKEKEDADAGFAECNDEYVKTEERVKKAYEDLRKADEAEKRLAHIKERIKNAGYYCEKARTDCEDHKKLIDEKRQRERELSDSAVRLAEKRAEAEKISSAVSDIGKIKSLEKSAAALSEDISRQERSFDRSEAKFNDAYREWMEKNNIYLRSQAGLLARNLAEGKPCPVCGSVSHPAPCRDIPEGYESLTPEAVNELKKNADRLQAEHTKCSNELMSRRNRLAEIRNRLSDHFSELVKKLADVIPDCGEISDHAAAERILFPYRKENADNIALLEKECEELDEIRKYLEGAEQKADELRKVSERYDKAHAELKERCASVTAELDSLRANLGFSDKNEADRTLRDAKSRLEEKRKIKEAAEKRADSARSEKERNEARIGKDESDLPGYEARRDAANIAYEKIAVQKNMPDGEWMRFADGYTADMLGSLRDEIDVYDKEFNSSLSKREGYLDIIKGREKPDIAAITEKLDKAEHERIRRRDECDSLRDLNKTDSFALKNISSVIHSFEEKNKRYSVAERLYRRFRGKESGARVGIETFVLRCYLERILDSANIRFSDMTNGNYELRMVGSDEAGKGRSDDGLDLRVYSSVTDSVREVRTLSGGESFMAALALALGTADQIKARSASVNLDILFIDEGFGSLDDTSRRQAVEVLRQMADGSKLVGIISHVTELRTEIEDKLVITKDKYGSTAKWEA